MFAYGYHLHDWCGEMLKRYHIAKPETGTGYIDRLVDQVIRAVDVGHIPKGQYGALMVDEGHDFEAEWLQLIVQMVDPETSSLLLLYDDAQSIYKKKKSLDFSTGRHTRYRFYAWQEKRSCCGSQVTLCRHDSVYREARADLP